MRKITDEKYWALLYVTLKLLNKIYSSLLCIGNVHQAIVSFWFAKLSAEKGALETAIGNLAKSHTNLLEKIQQALLKKVFEGGLIYDGHSLRTPRLHAALAHNYNNQTKRATLMRAAHFNFAKVEPLYHVLE